MPSYPYRRRVPTCVRRDTYRYFFNPGIVDEIWRRLEGAYGTIKRNPSFRTQEIICSKFFFRSTSAGNPVTVIRRRECGPSDVKEFHGLVDYENRVSEHTGES
jgi:hypothetical protein